MADHLLGAVRVDPVFDVAVRVVEEIALHLLGGLGLGCESIRRDTSIVDQHADKLLLALDLVVDTGNVLLVGDVSLDCVDGTWDILAVGLDDSVKLLLGATDDVHFGTIDGKSLGGHQSNTGSTT